MKCGFPVRLFFRMRVQLQTMSGGEAFWAKHTRFRDNKGLTQVASSATVMRRLREYVAFEKAAKAAGVEDELKAAELKKKGGVSPVKPAFLTTEDHVLSNSYVHGVVNVATELVASIRLGVARLAASPSLSQSLLLLVATVRCRVWALCQYNFELVFAY